MTFKVLKTDAIRRHTVGTMAGHCFNFTDEHNNIMSIPESAFSDKKPYEQMYILENCTDPHDASNYYVMEDGKIVPFKCAKYCNRDYFADTANYVPLVNAEFEYDKVSTH